jgi:hypothetical protein
MSERELAQLNLSVTPNDFDLLKDIFQPATRARMTAAAMVIFADHPTATPQEIAEKCVAVADATLAELAK